MKTLASTILSIALTAGLVSVAAAQGTAPAAPAAPAAKAAPPAKAAAPAAAPAAKAAPATPATPATPAAGAKAPVAPPKAPAPPAAPAEVAALAKGAGNWRCAGIAMGPAGESKMNATMRSKLSLDKWWVQTSFAETGGAKFKFESYTTYDVPSKKWHRVMVDNMGSYETAVSDGPKDGKVQWEATSRTAMGSAMGRHYEDMSNPKELKMWGEYSMDKGKSWMKAYEATCKR